MTTLLGGKKCQNHAIKGDLRVDFTLSLSTENLIRWIVKEVYYMLVTVKIAFKYMGGDILKKKHKQPIFSPSYTTFHQFCVLIKDNK